MELIATWDTDDPMWKANWRAVFDWSRGRIDRLNDTHRIEIWLCDGPFARAFRYARDELGRRRFDSDTGRPVAEPPADVLLDALPPHELRFGHAVA